MPKFKGILSTKTLEMRFLGARMWSSGNTSDYMLGADVYQTAQCCSITVKQGSLESILLLVTSLECANGSTEKYKIFTFV